MEISDNLHEKRLFDKSLLSPLSSDKDKSDICSTPASSSFMTNSALGGDGHQKSQKSTSKRKNTFNKKLRKM